eukprot:TRINITY_DN5554_c0_g1_i2.p1 TRINITY_DN5554_c0_g1~~TRINITY_DN5554_c0_g1_i2.p1  ORF type:complete len:361 (-),score=79.62 TRINITY_DN5554_c0_g1_i2:213-1295(-)
MGGTNSALRAIVGIAEPQRRDDLENQIPNAEPDITANSRNNNLFLGPQFFRNSRGNGNLPDLSLLGPLARRMAPQMHQTTTVKCPVNLNRNSLQLIPEIINEGDQERKKYRIQFCFDSSESGTIKVFYGATEEGNSQIEREEIEFKSLKICSEMRFERGLGQIYEQPESDWLDPLLFMDESSLVHDLDENYYPVAIIIQSDSGVYYSKNSSPSEREQVRISSQSTFGDLIHCSDDSYVIKPTKQKIMCSGRQFVIHDIFGLENGENETGKECVICMAEPRDTTVLPCRHLCLCSECAEELRQQSNKCPICRSTVKHMVQIKIGKEPLEMDESEDDEEFDSLKKNVVLESRTGGIVNTVEN